MLYIGGGSVDAAMQIKRAFLNFLIGLSTRAPLSFASYAAFYNYPRKTLPVLIVLVLRLIFNSHMDAVVGEFLLAKFFSVVPNFSFGLNHPTL